MPEVFEPINYKFDEIPNCCWCWWCPTLCDPNPKEKEATIIGGIDVSFAHHLPGKSTAMAGGNK